MKAKADKKDLVFFQVRDFPADLRRSFKVACAAEDISMREKLIELIRGYVKRKERKKDRK